MSYACQHMWTRYAQSDIKPMRAAGNNV